MKKTMKNFGVLFVTMLMLLPAVFADSSSASAMPLRASVITFHSGWNMVSVPVNTQVSMSDVATSCGTASYAWHLSESGYVKDSALVPGYGYWVKGTKDCDYQVAGGLSTEPMALFSGWNLVSSPSSKVGVSDYTGTCTVTGGPWHYNPSISNYERASALVPGEEYWYRVSSSCQLQGETPPAPPSNSTSLTLAYEALSEDTYRIASLPGDTACAATSSGDISYTAKLIRISSSQYAFGGANDAIPGGNIVDSVYYEPLASNAKVLIKLSGRDCYNWNNIPYGSSAGSAITFKAAGYGGNNGKIMFADSIDNVPGSPDTKGYVILAEYVQGSSDAIMVPVYPSTSSTGALRFSDSGSPGKLYYITTSNGWQVSNVPPMFVSQRGTEVTAIESASVSFNIAAAASPITPTLACTDSDGGKNYFVKGTGKGNYMGSTVSPVIYGAGSDPNSPQASPYGYSIFYDYCVSPNQLNEAYCDANGNLQAEGTPCPSGYSCSGGACVGASNNSTDYGTGPNSRKVCAAVSPPACQNGQRLYTYFDSDWCAQYKCVANPSTSDSAAVSWTEWKNRDIPTGTGDWENREAFSEVCTSPLAIECQTLGGADYSTTGQNVLCNPDEGLVCANYRNTGTCMDYEVRFLCAGGSTTANKPPVINGIGGQTTVNAGQASTIYVSAADPEGKPLTYAFTWDTYGAKEAGSTSSNSASHTYNTAGTYTVSVIVSDDQGATAAASTRVVVLPVATDTAAPFRHPWRNTTGRRTPTP